MSHTIRRALVALAAMAALLTGCTIEVPSEPAPPAQPAEDPQPAESDDEPFSGELTYDETILIMDLSWPKMTSSEQADICWGFTNMGADWAYEAVSGGTSGEFTYDVDAFGDFFRGECS